MGIMEKKMDSYLLAREGVHGYGFRMNLSGLKGPCFGEMIQLVIVIVIIIVILSPYNGESNGKENGK